MSSHARTLWEEGREPGRAVVALGFALAMTVVVVDLMFGEGLGALFDVCFPLLCIAVALLVRPRDFFFVGVLPPLMLAIIFVFIAIVQPSAIADPGDGVVQATVSGLSHHSGSLLIGYGLCLGVLFIRQQVLSRRMSGERASLVG